MSEKREHEVPYDRSTGLPNRALFIDKLSSTLASLPASAPSVLSVRLRQLKSIDRQYGDLVAEELVSAIAGRIEHNLAPEDFLARVDRNEFAVLVASSIESDSADLVRKKLENAFHSPFKLEEFSIVARVQIGIAKASGSFQTAEHLLAEAHAARGAASRFHISTGALIGRFRIVSFLGKGGMGEVYCAHDPVLNREVAIKILTHKISEDSIALKRFHQELRAIASLSHPNILDLHDVGSIHGRCYAVMEKLTGHTLRERLLSGALPLELALDYAVQISEGLAAAHEKSVVHRDLKPENIFITNSGRIKILDFGLATFLKTNQSDLSDTNDTAPMTQPGMILGTVGYMAPEQVLGQTTDERCDIFSFGAVLYEMLCGHPAFNAAHKIDVLNAILKKEPAPLDEIPPQVRLLLSQCLQKSPADRLTSAKELTKMLRCARLGWNQTETFTQ